MEGRDSSVRVSGQRLPKGRRNSGVVTNFFSLFPSARCGGLSAPVAHWQSPVGATSGVIGRGLCGVEHCRRPLPRFCMCVCVLQLSICIYLYLSHSRLTTTTLLGGVISVAEVRECGDEGQGRSGVSGWGKRSPRAPPFDCFITILGRPAPSRAPAGTRRARGRESGRVVFVRFVRCVCLFVYIYILAYTHMYVQTYVFVRGGRAGGVDGRSSEIALTC